MKITTISCNKKLKVIDNRREMPEKIRLEISQLWLTSSPNFVGSWFQKKDCTRAPQLWLNTQLVIMIRDTIEQIQSSEKSQIGQSQIAEDFKFQSRSKLGKHFFLAQAKLQLSHNWTHFFLAPTLGPFCGFGLAVHFRVVRSVRFHFRFNIIKFAESRLLLLVDLAVNALFRLSALFGHSQ